MKKSGKTRIATFLIKSLKHRYRILSIKHSCESNFDIDKQGKDSWRMKKAGAYTVTILSDKKLAIISDADNIDPLQMVTDLENLLRVEFDLVLIEGFSRLVGQNKNVFKIIAAKSTNDFKEIIKNVDEKILAVVSSEKIRTDYPTISFDEMDKLLELLERILSP